MAMLELDEMKDIIEIALDREIGPLTADVDLYQDLGMDSIGAVAMIVEIQRRFRVRINEQDVPGLRSPALLMEHLNRMAEVRPLSSA